MLTKNIFDEIKYVMIENEQQLLQSNSFADKSQPITVDEVYDEIDQLKRFPSSNIHTVKLCKFVSKLSIAINTFNTRFQQFAENISSDKESDLQNQANQQFSELKNLYDEYTRDITKSEKLITKQIYYDLLSTKIKAYPTITMHSPDGKIGIAGHTKQQVTNIVNDLQVKREEARQKNSNAWFVDEMYDYLVNSNNISGHARASLEQLKSKQHTLETQVNSEVRSTLDKHYTINDIKYDFEDDYIAIDFFNSRRDYYSKISSDLQIYGGLKINHPTQNESKQNIDTRKILELEDKSYKTLIASRVYSSYRAYRINEAIKLRKLNDLNQSS